VATAGRPHEGVGDLALEVLEGGEVALLGVGVVERDGVLDDGAGNVLAKVGVVGRDNGETLSIGLPGEGGDVVLVLDNLDGVVLLAETEELEVAEGGLLGLGLAGVAVDLDAEVVALVLPEELALEALELIRLCTRLHLRR